MWFCWRIYTLAKYSLLVQKLVLQNCQKFDVEFKMISVPRWLQMNIWGGAWEKAQMDTARPGRHKKALPGERENSKNSNC